jgi:hypothetical protein
MGGPDVPPNGGFFLLRVKNVSPVGGAEIQVPYTIDVQLGKSSATYYHLNDQSGPYTSSKWSCFNVIKLALKITPRMTIDPIYLSINCCKNGDEVAPNVTEADIQAVDP